MVLLESDDALAERPDILLPVVVVCLETLFVDDTSLLSQLLVLLAEHFPVFLHLAELDLLVIKDIVEALEIFILTAVLLLHVLQLLSGV